MLNELIRQVTEKTGISKESAATAVTTVLDCLKKKLPAPIASQIEGMMGGAGGAVSDAASHAKDSASNLFDDAKEKLGSIFNKK